VYATLFRSSNNGTATQATFNDSTSSLCGIVIVSLKASWIFLWIPWPSLPKIKTVDLVQSISQYGFEGFFELLLKLLVEKILNPSFDNSDKDFNKEFIISSSVPSYLWNGRLKTAPVDALNTFWLNGCAPPA